MLLFRLIKLGEGRRVGWLVGAPVVRTDVRTVGLTARGGRRRMAFKMTTGESESETEGGRERERLYSNGYHRARERREQDPRLSANA